jgi:hypothetical protein
MTAETLVLAGLVVAVFLLAGLLLGDRKRNPLTAHASDKLEVGFEKIAQSAKELDDLALADENRIKSALIALTVENARIGAVRQKINGLGL